jgi:hypothetical protein
MAVLHSGYISPEKIAADIELAKQKLGPEVVRLRYNVGPNMWDDPAIFFRVVLSDSAAKEERLGDVTQRITWFFFNELHPIENWGLRPYFSFRSQSEQAERDGIDLDWT